MKPSIIITEYYDLSNTSAGFRCIVTSLLPVSVPGHVSKTFAKNWLNSVGQLFEAEKVNHAYEHALLHSEFIFKTATARHYFYSMILAVKGMTIYNG